MPKPLLIALLLSLMSLPGCVAAVGAGAAVGADAAIEHEQGGDGLF
ncbi:hypothetical protein [Algicella marina]|uniref:Uncharacterized protein n=1 Tax=Algicella marina TaxID=2683284 RepID=A0A6P1SXA5_9RHOB|nr:hypothetical protein [Algicella marina]QHQ34111.1 hypothetical protein GO499_02380 [Algicella marina]